MTALEELLQRRWILKTENSELYYKVKDALKDIRKVMQEKFGYIIVVNPYLIKLEKIPGKAESWMGIQEFKTIKEFQMFCYLLMFLEEKERDSQFVLSMLTEYIQVQFPSGEIEWTNISSRRQLIRVIKYALSIGIMLHYGEGEDRFAQDEKTEVLYENTGVSRYFMRNFTRELMEYKTPQDFEKSEWISMDEDRGIVRRQRIYRRLLLSPGVYRSDDDDDFLYIRNYRNQIQNDFQSFFSCELHVHRSSSFLSLSEDCMMGTVFPSRNALSDMILLIHKEIDKRIRNKQFTVEGYERLCLDKEEFIKICEKVIKKDIEKLPKKYQEEGNTQVANTVMNAMQSYGFIECKEDYQTLIIYPAVGKLVGSYAERK